MVSKSYCHYQYRTLITCFCSYCPILVFYHFMGPVRICWMVLLWARLPRLLIHNVLLILPLKFGLFVFHLAGFNGVDCVDFPFIAGDESTILQLCSQHRFKIAKVDAIVEAWSQKCWLTWLFLFPCGVFTVLNVWKSWWEPDGCWNDKLSTSTSTGEELRLPVFHHLLRHLHLSASRWQCWVTFSPLGWLRNVFAVFVGYGLTFPLEQWLHPHFFFETSLQSSSGNL